METRYAFGSNSVPWWRLTQDVLCGHSGRYVQHHASLSHPRLRSMHVQSLYIYTYTRSVRCTLSYPRAESFPTLIVDKINESTVPPPTRPHSHKYTYIIYHVWWIDTVPHPIRHVAVDRIPIKSEVHRSMAPAYHLHELIRIWNRDIGGMHSCSNCAITVATFWR